MKKELYTVNQVAELLMVDPLTVIRYIKKGDIKAFKFGRQWRIRKEMVEKLMEEAEGDNRYDEQEDNKIGDKP